MFEAKLRGGAISYTRAECQSWRGFRSTDTQSAEGIDVENFTMESTQATVSVLRLTVLCSPNMRPISRKSFY